MDTIYKMCYYILLFIIRSVNVCTLPNYILITVGGLTERFRSSTSKFALLKNIIVAAHYARRLYVGIIKTVETRAFIWSIRVDKITFLIPFSSMTLLYRLT